MGQLYAQPLGDDFAGALVKGLIARFTKSPVDLARVTVILNTRRAARRVATLFQAHAPILLPRILTVADFSQDPFHLADLPERDAPLLRKLRLASLLRAYHLAQPERMPERAIFDHTDQLIALIDEFHGQDIPLEALRKLETEDQQTHWQELAKLLEIALGFDSDTPLQSSTSRFRASIDALANHWADQPPQDPVIVAGSSGSRAETRALMQLVLKQDQGSVILPGFDPYLPDHIWPKLTEDQSAFSHPQSQLAQTLQYLGAPNPNDLPQWYDAETRKPVWSGLTSLALEPAPVTDRWLEEAPKRAKNLSASCAHVSVINAPDQRLEAQSIAIQVAKSVEANESIAIISPDRNLMRMLSAALSPMSIKADEALGAPLSLTPAGILARQVLKVAQTPDETTSWLEMLKHALVANEARGEFRLSLQNLEFDLRDKAQLSWSMGLTHSSEAKDLRDWFERLAVEITALANTADRRPQKHLTIMQLLIAGPAGLGNPPESEDWQVLSAKLEELAAHDANLSEFSLFSYQDLFASLLTDELAQPAYDYHPLVSIWGTLEARSQSADHVVLAGLNEGIWPNAKFNDPWLNRTNRIELGLLTPDRSIALAAHDFQQAINANKVTLSYSQNIQGSAGNPSRWITRIAHLIEGLGTEGKEVWETIQLRGAGLLARAIEDNKPMSSPAPAPRPAPRPPLNCLTKISATQIEDLIRNPYAVYASRILKLRPLAPFQQSVDYRLRGTLFHAAFEAINKRIQTGQIPTSQEAYHIIFDNLAERFQQPTTLKQWAKRLSIAYDHLDPDLRGDVSDYKIAGIELRGEMPIDEVGVTLSCFADRVDISEAGLRIIDYKSGSLPSDKVCEQFTKQMPAMAVIGASGGFNHIDSTQISNLSYISLDPKIEPRSIQAEEETFWEELLELLSNYQTNLSQGFVARDRPQKISDGSDFDQLSRFGEWDESKPAELISVGGGHG